MWGTKVCIDDTFRPFYHINICLHYSKTILNSYICRTSYVVGKEFPITKKTNVLLHPRSKTSIPMSIYSFYYAIDNLSTMFWKSELFPP